MVSSDYGQGRGTGQGGSATLFPPALTVDISLSYVFFPFSISFPSKCLKAMKYYLSFRALQAHQTVF